MKFKYILTNALLVCMMIPMLVMSQGRPYEGPEDPAGDPAMEREGFMNGNRWRMMFNNNTQLADYPRNNTSKWPDNNQGTKMLDVGCVDIGAEVYLYQDTIPIDDPDEAARLAALGQIDTLFYVQTQDYHRVGGHLLDDNWNHTVEWALAPVPGYVNLAQDYPALSNRPDSWPPEGWPSRGFGTKWQGEWFGRYGRGLVSANLESYIVANDAQDQEYIIDRNSGAAELLIKDGPRYYPRRESDVYIGDFARPGFEATTQIGRPWGGLGIRVEVRGYQWNNDETRDIIFWEYNIANISDYDILRSGFGYYLDVGIGGDFVGDGESAHFDVFEDLTFIWEIGGTGLGGRETGAMAFAFLESPGKPFDNVDNDDDGLLNESRENPAGNIIGPTDGIHDLGKFLKYYNYQEHELKPHFEGDEDQDWKDGIDLNGNGTYSYYDEELNMWNFEPGEVANDDVGLDGVSPIDLNYTGPDKGECNHMPDYEMGTGCEPNFNAQDVSEADQLGLTSFHIHAFATWGTVLHNQDENLWKQMDSNQFEVYGTTNHIMLYFASTAFPLHQGRVERISSAIIGAYDDLTGLNSEDRSAPKLFRKKKNAQVIYERDYQFAKPPLMPTLTAYAGDGKVTLVWDDVADKYTREPLLARVNDFEGYKLYRSTDKYFQDTEYITNAYGIKKFRAPIFQCDKVDSIFGFSLNGVNGEGRSGTTFYLGEDTGLSHSYIDNDVVNGKTYYYALVAYDYGIEQFQIAPAENEAEFDIDSETEQITRVHKNLAVVIPRYDAAGYIPPSIEIDEDKTSDLILTGEIVPEIIAPGGVKVNHTYRVTFSADSMGHYRKEGTPLYNPMDRGLSTEGLYIYDITDGDKLIYQETRHAAPRNNIVRRKSNYENSGIWDYYVFDGQGLHTDVVDGFRLTLNLAPLDTTLFDAERSGWKTGNSKLSIITGMVAQYFPWDYDIIFTNGVSTEGTKSKTGGFKDQNNESVDKSTLILDYGYNFYVVNNNSVDENGEPEKLDLIAQDMNANGVYDWKTDIIYASHLSEDPAAGINWAGSVFAISFANVTDESALPKTGDVYQVRFSRPASDLDSFVFTIRPQVEKNEKLLKDDMEKIKVVPNPYIATNAMESEVSNPYKNQERRIMFTHLPAQCLIRIFTPTGLLVDTIEVSNDMDNGIAHWDLLTKEDLEIASGMYVYQVKDNATGHQKIGKFAVIK